MTYDKDYYEGDSSNYSLFGGYTGLSLRMCRFFVYRKAISIIKRHKTRGKLLDLGCAYGFWAEFSRKRGFLSSGCDISGFAISEARQRFSYIDFLRMDIEKPFVFRDGEFDVITAFDVLEHCKNLEFVLSEIKRVLNPEGVLLVTVPDTDLFSEEKDRDPTHVWYMNMSGWENTFMQNGFEVKESIIFPSILRRLNPGWCVRFILLKHSPIDS